MTNVVRLDDYRARLRPHREKPNLWPLLPGVILFGMWFGIWIAADRLFRL